MVDVLVVLAALSLGIFGVITLSIISFHFYKWRFNRWLKQFASEDCCMCGTEMKYHSLSDNHAPLSEYDFYRAYSAEKKLDWFWRKV